MPGSGRSPGEENGHLLQDSCLENPMDRGAWWATVCGVAKELGTIEGIKHHHLHPLGRVLQVLSVSFSWLFSFAQLPE